MGMLSINPNYSYDKKNQMLLVIDIGNSNIEFGVFTGCEITAKWRTTTILDTVDEFGLDLVGFLGLNKLSIDGLKGCIISSVVPLLTGRMVSMCRSFLNIVPLVVDISQIALPIDVMYDHPEEVGADRLVNAVAVHTEYKKDSIIIDFGTATTFCVITAEGKYLGGCITPGIQVPRRSL